MLQLVMNLEGIMLTEIRYCMCSFMQTKDVKFVEAEGRLVAAKDWKRKCENWYRVLVL